MNVLKYAAAAAAVVFGVINAVAGAGYLAAGTGAKYLEKALKDELGTEG